MLRVLSAAAALSLLAAPALAHTGAGAGSGFAAGFAHPLFGLDHLLAMLAVGAWGLCSAAAPSGWCRRRSSWR